MIRLKTLTDPCRCIFCGIIDDLEVSGCRRVVEIHHIQEKANGGKDTSDNLIPCCSNHHSLIHQGKIIPLKWYRSTGGFVLRYKNEKGEELFTKSPSQFNS